MSQDEMKNVAAALVKSRNSINRRDEDNKIRDRTAFSALVVSPETSTAYRIQICASSYEHHPELHTANQLLAKATGKQEDSQYEVSVTCFRDGELQAVSSSAQHFCFPTTDYAPVKSQYISTVDDESLTIGCLELDLEHTYEGIVITTRNANETIFQQAVRSFKARSHAFKVSNPSSSKSNKMLAESEVIFEGINVQPAVSSPVLVKGAKTLQDGLHVFEFSRRLDDLWEGDSDAEASQFEVFVGIYNESSDGLSWYINTTTGGETSRSKGASPETAWALHPHLPLLVWLLPGHRLRLSNIESKFPPITIAGQSNVLQNELAAVDS